MDEFVIGEARYRFRRLCAYDQWTLLRRMTPLMPVVTAMSFGRFLPNIDLARAGGLLTPLAAVSDEELDSALQACLGACEGPDGEPDHNVGDLVQIAMAVMTHNFSALFAMKRADFRPTSTDGVAFAAVSMPDDEDWLFRPVMRDKCKGESLWDGTLKIEHIAKLNDALSVADENETRARKAAEVK